MEREKLAMKKIVITGSKGLIGTELCKFFKKLDWEDGENLKT